MRNRQEIPFKVRREPTFVQRAYIHEFKRVMENEGSAVAAVKAANKLLDSVHSSRHIHDAGMSRSVQIRATITELEAVRAEKIIPKDILDSVRGRFANPFLALFEVGTEGISVGEGVRKFWSFRAIKELADRIKQAAGRVFVQHSARPDDPARQSYGSLIWGFARKVGNTLKAYAVAHITDDAVIEKIKDGTLDVCSLEGQVLMSRSETDNHFFIDRVDEVTGLALADSDIDSPGFTGAGVVAVINELERIQEMAKDDDKGTGVETLDIYTVKVAVERFNWKPEDLFTKDRLLEVPTVAKAVKDATDKADGDHKKEIERLKAALEPLQKAETAKSVETEIGKSALLTDANKKVKSYIARQITNNGAILAAKETDRAGLIDTQIKAELETIKSLGISFADADDDDDANKGGDDGDGNKGGDDGDGNKGGDNKAADKNDMTDPANNALIPKGV